MPVIETYGICLHSFLGVELDTQALANKMGHDLSNREAYDVDDGSVVDWWRTDTHAAGRGLWWSIGQLEA